MIYVTIPDELQNSLEFFSSDLKPSLAWLISLASKVRSIVPYLDINSGCIRA